MPATRRSGPAARSRRFAAAWPRRPACSRRPSRVGCRCDRTGVPVVVEGATVTAGPDAGSRRASVIWAGPGLLRRHCAFPSCTAARSTSGIARDAPRVAVISETMARQYFGGADAASAVGRRFRLEVDTDGERLDRGGRRGAGHQDLGSRRSDAAGVLPIVRAVGPAADDRRGPHLPRRRRPRRHDAARAARGERRAARRVGQDDGAVSRGVAASRRRPWRRSSAGSERSACAWPASASTPSSPLPWRGGRARLVSAWRSARSAAAGGLDRGPRRRVLVGVGTGAGLALTLLAILALRAVVVPTPGISMYRPTADPLALLTIAAFMAMVGARRRLRAGAARGDGGSAGGAAPRLSRAVARDTADFKS